jgi:hypothetical protein
MRLQQKHIYLKVPIIKTLTLIILMNINLAFTQEWKSLKSYQKETGNSFLWDGCWLKKDRKRQTVRWKQANKYNLNIENGNKKYKSISQIRDFYIWFDEERIKQGHEIKWIRIAATAAGQLSKLDRYFIRVFIVRKKEVVKFANEGSEKVFAFAFPQLKRVYFSNEIIIGKDAENWDKKYGVREQCVILEPLCKKLSKKAIKKLERMAKGKGLFNLGVPKELKYEGKIDDCQARFEHGIMKLFPNYSDNP